MRKKILFTAYSLTVGGIETALINILNRINYDKYEVTLLLEKKEGLFLDEIPKNVKIQEYRISANKFVLFRKIINYFKYLSFKIKYHNKYDFAGCFATHSNPGAKIASLSSKNNAYWVHNDYTLSCNDSEIKDFFKSKYLSRYKHIVFVSKESKNHFIEKFPQYEKKCIVCNNLINNQRIIELSNEKITESKDKFTFINVGRHDQKQKRLTLLIEACECLKKQKVDFQLWLVGDGPDHQLYQDLIKEKKLEDVIKILGVKKNPFPYYKKADAFVLTSNYEGFPVVFVESLIMNLPIISTIEVSDEAFSLKDGYGLITKPDKEIISTMMRQVMDDNYHFKKFDANSFNKINFEILMNIIDDKNC